MNADFCHRRRTLLVVAGEFPPLKTIGRIRTTKFVEHLRELGWDSIVLTLEPSGSEPNYDSALAAEVPFGIEVVRVPLVTFDERITRFAKRLLGREPVRTGIKQSERGSTQKAPTGVRQADERRSGAVERLQLAVKHWIRVGFDIPDSYLPWVLKALPVAREIVARHRVDLVLTSLPPFSAAYIGYRLAGETGLPWVVDYRDLWYGDVLREWLPRWRQRLELILERRLLRRARVIVTVSAQKTAYMRRLHPRLTARWETLTNGYDVELYAFRVRTRPVDPEVVQFVYTGRLFKNRRGYAFAQALGRIKRDAPDLARRVRVQILGGVAPEIAARYQEILSQDNLTEQFEFTGDVGYEEAMEAQVNCDYLLLIVDTGETSDGVIPGKLFEYVAAKRPIFGLCDPGATQQIIAAAGLGTVVDAEDVDGCESALRQILSRPVPEQCVRNDAYLTQFDRRCIAAELGRLLNETLSTGRENA